MTIQAQSVTEIINKIKNTLESSFRAIFVLGEISNLSSSAAGHWYFNLSDGNSSISCALFKGDAMRNPIIKKLKDGDQIYITGPISVYGRRGTFQLLAKKIMPALSASVFLTAFFITIIGNLLWHKSERQIVKAELEEHKNDGNNPLAMLSKTVPAIEALFAKAQNTQGMDLCEEVDKVLDTHVHPFTEKRKTFMDILGQAKGAEILLDVAYGERMLNRVWSAASDGHHQEALNSITESLENYKKAAGKLA